MSTVLTWIDTSGAFVALSLDVADGEDYGNDAAVTDYPAEEGFDPADGARPTPPDFTLTGMITDSPIVVPTGQMGSVTGAVQSTQVPTYKGKPLTATALVFSGNVDRVATCDDLLQGLVENSVFVAVLTTLRQVDNALVTSYKVNRDASTGNSINVSITFRVVRIVSTQTVTVPAPRQRRGHPASAVGSQPILPLGQDPRDAFAAPTPQSFLSSLMSGGP